MIAGVDGCKGGWIVAMAGCWPCKREPNLSLCPDFKSVLELTKSCRIVVVDMPIGVPSGARLRTCDLEAREMLENAAGRVFFTPPRESLKAKTPEEFQRIHRKLRGKGAGLVVWGIIPKIKEVDELMTAKLQERILEFHPELAFLRLAEKVLASKHTEEGIQQRIRLLRGNIPGLEGLIADNVGPKAKPDDILDAVVGLYAAHCITQGPDYNRRLPAAHPPMDEKGLRMEIWF